MRSLPSSLAVPALVAAALGVPACGGETGGRASVDTTVDTATGAAGPRSSGYAELRTSVCDTLTNSFDCARAVEDAQFPEPGVSRSGDTLRFALADGDTARYADDPGDAAEVVYYSYQDHWADPGLYLLQLQYYEGSAFLLVDDSTGAETRLPDWPLRSPDGRRFAVLSLDLVAGYGPNTLQVWALDDGSPVREWETQPSHWGPREGEWVAPDTLRFIQHGYCEWMGGEGGGMCERPARAWQAGDAWHIEAMEDSVRAR